MDAENLIFIKVTQCYWTAKNNLHKDVLEYIKTIDATLLPVSQLQKFILNFSIEIDSLNKKHSKCRPFSVTKSSDGLRIYGVFYIEFHTVKHHLIY